MANGTWPVTIALGLGLVLVIGGIVNVARIAFAATVWSIAIAGLLFAIVHLKRSVRSRLMFIRPGWDRMTWIEAASVGTFIALAISLTIATQLPPDVFNFPDDLQKYFAHPVRQLQTGTLYGSPLSALGSETLGGIAFLHSFVLSIAPIEFINGVDAVFGLFLLMCLGAAAGWRRMMPLPGALLPPVLIAAINPQYVNVSALYLGAAFMATAVLLTADEREEYPPSALAIGLVYGGLVALKPTFALFVALHLPLAAIALSIVHGSVRVSILWALRSAAFTALALSPWIILHLPHYVDASTLGTDAVPDGPREQINLFSGARLLYGATMASYTMLIGLALLAALWGVIGLLQDRSKSSLQRSSNLLAAAITVTLAYAIVLLLSSIIAGFAHSLRYSIPFLLGVVPLITVLSARKLSSWPSWLSIGLPLTAYTAAVISFLPSLLERCRQAIEYRSIHSYTLRMPANVQAALSRAALSTASAQEVQKLQHLIPPDEPFIAWINQPYHLNFRRNPIFDAEPAGVATSWARLPPSVRYVIWEYQGSEVRNPQDYIAWAHSAGRQRRLIAVRALAFAQALNAKVQKATVIYVDDRFVVARFSQM
jgi:hypothetical protein